MLLFFLLDFIFASTIIVNKILLQSVPLFLFIALRMLAGGLMLLLISNMKGYWQSSPLAKKDLSKILLISLFTTLIPAFLKAYAIKYLLVAKTTLIGCSDQAIALLCGYFILGEVISIRQSFSIALVLSGVIMLAIIQTPATASLLELFSLSTPDSAMLAYVITSRIGWTLMQKFLRKNKIKSAQINALTMLIAGTCCMAIHIYQAPVFLLATEVSTISLFLYSIIIGNVIGHTLYGYVLKYYSAHFVALNSFLLPFFGVLIGFLALGEKPRSIIILPGSLILIGIIISHLEEK